MGRFIYFKRRNMYRLLDRYLRLLMVWIHDGVAANVRKLEIRNISAVLIYSKPARNRCSAVSR